MDWNEKEEIRIEQKKERKKKEEGGEFDNPFQSIILCNTIIHYTLLHYISYVKYILFHVRK